MLKHKTAKRLATAIKSVEELRAYLERAHQKLTTESAIREVDEGLTLWLVKQAHYWQKRRNAEPKASEAYRFFDGKSEGLQAVIRHLGDESGTAPPRATPEKGYLSARDTATSDRQEPLKATGAFYDTVSEQSFA